MLLHTLKAKIPSKQKPPKHISWKRIQNVAQTMIWVSTARPEGGCEYAPWPGIRGNRIANCVASESFVLWKNLSSATSPTNVKRWCQRDACHGGKRRCSDLQTTNRILNRTAMSSIQGNGEKKSTHFITPMKRQYHRRACLKRRMQPQVWKLGERLAAKRTYA